MVLSSTLEKEYSNGGTCGSKKQRVPFDIFFVGSGVSASYTILKLLPKIASCKCRSTISIGIAEATGEFHTGIAYGSRSGDDGLTFTELDEFLPTLEKAQYIEWLKRNRHFVLEYVENRISTLSRAWCENVRVKISENSWGELYLPRALFGIYLSEKVSKCLEVYRQKKLIETHFVSAEIVDVEKSRDGYRLMTEAGKSLFSRQVVLGVGGLPRASLANDSIEVTDNRICYVSDVYSPSLPKNLQKVKQWICGCGKSKINVLVVGSNASALEILHHMFNLKEVRSVVAEWRILTTSAKMPEAGRTDETPLSYAPDKLVELFDAGDDVTAEAIYLAAIADIESAYKAGLTISQTLRPISRQVVLLCNKLTVWELNVFVTMYGTEIGRLQRRAAEEYTRIVDTINNEGKLARYCGYFHSIEAVKHSKVDCLYTEERDSPERKKIADVDILINCTGSAKSEKLSPLLASLLRRGLCEFNASERGLKVSSQFEVYNNLYLMGPMLAGNVVADNRIWHAEHCGRIIQLSSELAGEVFSRLLESDLDRVSVS